jgi:hypothetical protein
MHPPSLSNHRLFNVFGYADGEVEVDGKGKGFERLLRGVRSGLHRGKREETQARRSVEQQIRSEVCESLTEAALLRTGHGRARGSRSPPRKKSA